MVAILTQYLLLNLLTDWITGALLPISIGGVSGWWALTTEE